MLVSLNRLSTLLQRTALCGFFVAAMVMLAGVAREAEPREGASEESVHAASDYAAALLTATAGGADDDGGSDLPLDATSASWPTVVPRHSAVLRPHSADLPSAPARAHPAARGPPRDV